MMWPPVIRVPYSRVVYMLDIRRGTNREQRRARIYGKSRKYLREWGL